MKINIEFNIKSSYRNCIEVPEDIGLKALQIMDSDIGYFRKDSKLAELLDPFIDHRDIDFSDADIEDFEVSESEDD